MSESVHEDSSTESTKKFASTVEFRKKSNQDAKRVVFCLMGATATGKTDIACALTNYFPFEIISIDSALIYREMNIGTAKPDPETLAKYPHHLLDIIDPIDTYNVANCVKDVTNIADNIFARGKLPLLVGGTMMYFHALQNGIADLPVASKELRQEILNAADIHGWEYLHAQLDAKTAAKINPLDKARVQRALEVYMLTKQSIFDLIANTENSKPEFAFVNLLLMPKDRSWVHKRIAERFTNMLNCGLVAEVEELVAKWQLHLDNTSMRCVGYRQVFEYLQGAIDYQTMQEKGIAATRQLAKRQLTWLRKWPNANNFVAEDKSNLAAMREYIKINL